MTTNSQKYNADELREGRLTPAMAAWFLTEAVRVWQEAHGLKPDGKLGPKTRRAWWLEVSPPSDVKPPKGPASWRKFYGTLPWHDVPEKSGRIVVDRAWVRANIVSVTLHTGQSIRLHRKIAEAFPKVFQRACESSMYTPRSVQTFVARHKGWDPKRAISEHSWGAAVDFDPPRNAMGGHDTDGGPSMMRKHSAFVEVFKAMGWSWGGDWRMMDDMHFAYGSNS